MVKFSGFKTEEILTCFLLVIVGYFIAKIFNRSCANRVDGFSVGGEIVYCNPTLKDPPQKCPGNIDCPKCGRDSCECPKSPCIFNSKTPGYTYWEMPNTCTCPENTKEVTITNSKNQKVSRCVPKSKPSPLNKCYKEEHCWDTHGEGYAGEICPFDVLLDRKIYTEGWCCNMSRPSKERSCRAAWRKK